MEGRPAPPKRPPRPPAPPPLGRHRPPFPPAPPAANSDAAAEHVYSILGSRHRMKRRSIHIDTADEIDPRTSTEPSILHHFREEIAAQGGTLAPAAEEE